MIKYFLWGAGMVGRRFYKHLPSKDVIGFIDSDISKIGTFLYDKPIISFDEYLKHYRMSIIVISCFSPLCIIKELEANGVYDYLLCTDCPGEWLDDNPRIEYEKYIDSIIKTNCAQAVYGISLFSLYYCNRIFKKTGMYPDIISGINNNDSLIDKIRKEFPQIHINNLNNILVKQYEYIYNCYRNDEDIRRNFKGSVIIEVMDCCENIHSYWNEQFRKFKDIYKGKRCFIIGSGPSLTINDLEKLYNHKEICFGVNDQYRLFSRTSWRPSFYVSEDTAFLQDNREILYKLGLDYIFLADTIGLDTIDFYKKTIGDAFFPFHVSRISNPGHIMDFSDDITKKLCFGGTVTYACIQFAAYMGFSRIYLLGVDFTGGRKGGPYGHCFDNKIEGRNYAELTYYAFLTAKEYSKRKGFTIYNATRGGELEVFERVDFDSLF